ncbi:hypothetical protein [Segetibacter aerophilus]|uniref:Uncharacterized protein n=1 Tax=Segetibacter aerophilus TaxID=670293 RepID=A0A512BHY4_9BACT|nr:hypothetical protein [Segetibacter aerophilus]GEO11560.1 hypothetical protein SAE01_40560 [Segetibacter aerophilus]
MNISHNRYATFCIRRQKNFLRKKSGVLNAGKGGIFKEDKYSQITKEFLKGQSTVGSATGFDELNKFNSIGREWLASDPRSTGLINVVQGSLTNPNTDLKKAQAFYKLRSYLEASILLMVIRL